VAIDVQGAKVARPYVEKAEVTYTALVDENNILGNLFGVNYVPLHYVIDEFGIYRMKEREPQKIKEFLEQKIDKKLVAKTDAVSPVYDISRLKSILEKNPENVKAHLMMGDIMVQQGRFEDGIKEYRIAVELDKKSGEGLFRIGRVMLRQDKKTEALVEFKKAQKLDPTNWIIRKQIWAIEHPERFYDGKVDYGWQKEQIEKS
jgi:tetratricopeptide (TPR) repeat protein